MAFMHAHYLKYVHYECCALNVDHSALSCKTVLR